MAVLMPDPHIWVTSLSKLLSGDAMCEWAAWFHAHYKDYDKLPGDFDSAAWIVEHRELVNARREQLVDEGYSVHIELENKFRRIGKTGIVVSGQPDIFAIRDGVGVIEDCKTGKPKTADPLQVLIYMLLFPIGNPVCENITLSGRLIYKTSDVYIPADGVDEKFRDRFVAMVQKVGGEKPLPKLASWTECDWCKIGPADCLYRVSEPPESAEAETDLF